MAKQNKKKQKNRKTVKAPCSNKIHPFRSPLQTENEKTSEAGMTLDEVTVRKKIVKKFNGVVRNMVHKKKDLFSYTAFKYKDIKVSPLRGLYIIYIYSV